MRQGIVSGLMVGLVAAGCGVQPLVRPVSTTPKAVGAQARVAKTGKLTVQKALSLPAPVEGSYDQDKYAFLAGFTRANSCKTARFLNARQIQKLSVGTDVLGYVITPRGTGTFAQNGKVVNGAFLVDFYYDADGVPLGYGSAFYIVDGHDRTERLPSRLRAQSKGPLSCSFLRDEPQAVTTACEALYPKQTRALASRFDPFQTQPLVNLPGAMEIKYHGDIVGYMEDSVTSATGTGDFANFVGIQSTNYLDPNGVVISSRGQSAQPDNTLGFWTFEL